MSVAARAGRATLRVQVYLRWLGGKRAPLMVLFLLAPFVVQVAVLARFGRPVPRIHDEFSYLLAGDTLAHGRLANAEPRSAEHFESMHVLVKPSYASKYPPGAPLFLAVGQVVLGHAHWGVVLGVGLACAATYWASLAWMGRAWACLSGLLSVGVLGISHYWVRSYWGGAVCFAGAMLSLGGYRRLMRGQAGGAWGLGAGFALLLLTRPYEGGLLGLGLCLLLLRDSVVDAGVRQLVLRRALPVAAVWVASALSLQVAVNLAVTGDALRMPYVEHNRQYLTAGLFWPGPPASGPTARVEALRLQQEFEYTAYQKLHEAPFLFTFVGRSSAVVLAMLSVAVVAPLALGGAAVMAAPTWGVVGLFALLLGGTALESWTFPHYTAPLAALGWLLQLRLAQRIWWICQRRLRRRAWLGLVGAAVVLAALAVWGTANRLNRLHRTAAEQGAGAVQLHPTRQATLESLLRQPGRHLVFVLRARGYDMLDEWVYNGADLEGARVLFVRLLSPASNTRLVRDYPGRRVWLCRPEGPEVLTEVHDVRELPAGE